MRIQLRSRSACGIVSDKNMQIAILVKLGPQAEWADNVIANPVSCSLQARRRTITVASPVEARQSLARQDLRMPYTDSDSPAREPKLYYS